MYQVGTYKNNSWALVSEFAKSGVIFDFDDSSAQAEAAKKLEKYVSQYFKEHFHITLSKYVTYLRLEHAKQLLQNLDIPVTEVAMLSGYQNVSYFIRSFKKTYGVSPLKYRKNEPSTWI